MTKADTIFKENITKIMEEGVWSEQARPKYKDGTTANSKYITGAFAEYDLSKGEFPITTLRPIAIKSAIKEVFWIYQDQTNSLDVLEDKYNVHYWNDWEVEGVLSRRPQDFSLVPSKPCLMFVVWARTFIWTPL